MLEKMSEMIAEQLNCDAETITADTSFKDDLGADSLDLFELVMALEDEYNIEIPAACHKKVRLSVHREARYGERSERNDLPEAGLQGDFFYRHFEWIRYIM